MNVIKKFYSLDILRGLAAFSIVIMHWKLFLYIGNVPGQNVALPLFTELSWVYKLAGFAVDLFFSLSGFIFFWLYTKRIQGKEVSFKNFFIFRFSRLYPLHFATLILVIILQVSFFRLTGNYFVHRYNDLYHFILNCFFASSWGFEKGDSFNGPIWSVSVEVLLYTVFFVAARRGYVRPRNLIGFMLVGCMLYFFYSPIGRGLYSFFAGGLAFWIYDKICNAVLKKEETKRLWAIFWGVPLIWIILFFWLKFGFFSGLLWQIFSGGTAYKIIRLLSIFFVTGIVFPATILMLALIETLKGPIGKKFEFIGDISYSTYLLHFPLQLIFAYVAIRLGTETYFFANPVSMIIFMMILIGTCTLSRRYFEAPLQQIIRRAWKRNQKQTQSRVEGVLKK